MVQVSMAADLHPSEKEDRYRQVNRALCKGVWLGMSPLNGIEDCLRMYTDVEVLDGESIGGVGRSRIV